MTGIRYSVNADHLLVPNSVAREPSAQASTPQPRAPRRPVAPAVQITVTREIIDAAEQRNSSHCMISDAIKAAVGNASSISTDLQTIRWSDKGRRLRYVYLTPQAAQIALLRFDQGAPTEPFTFRLRGAQVTKLDATGPGRDRRPAGRHTPAMPPGTKRELVTRSDTQVANGAAVVGGSPPPLGALAHSPTGAVYRGTRRTYGLRVLKP
jgi:hypothetical protein